MYRILYYHHIAFKFLSFYWTTCNKGLLSHKKVPISSRFNQFAYSGAVGHNLIVVVLIIYRQMTFKMCSPINGYEMYMRGEPWMDSMALEELRDSLLSRRRFEIVCKYINDTLVTIMHANSARECVYLITSSDAAAPLQWSWAILSSTCPYMFGNINRISEDRFHIIRFWQRMSRINKRVMAGWSHCLFPEMENRFGRARRA